MQKTISALWLGLLLPLGLVAQEGKPILPDPERVTDAAIHEIGQALAMAMADPMVREWIHQGLISSKYVESRIAFNRVLSVEKEMREAVMTYRSAPWSWAKVSVILPDLELYFPIADHRKMWNGGTPVEIGVPFEEGYMVYSADGGSWQAAEDFEPRQPTLRLSRSEIDYDDLPSALKGGSRTASFLKNLAAETEDLPEDLAFLKDADPTRHSFLTFLQVKDDFEGAFRGSMEIDVFGSIDGGNNACTRITGVDENEIFVFPSQQRRVATAMPAGSWAITVEVWEDDRRSCSHSSRDDFVGSINVGAGLYGSILAAGASNIRLGPSMNLCGDGRCQFPETRGNCPQDCRCGDGVCSSSESCSNCPNDCGSCCGNGVCERFRGENEFTCSEDCDCGPDVFICLDDSCGDGVCEPDEVFLCPEDC